MDPKKKEKKKRGSFFFRLRIARFITGKGKKKNETMNSIDIYKYTRDVIMLKGKKKCRRDGLIIEKLKKLNKIRNKK